MSNTLAYQFFILYFEELNEKVLLRIIENAEIDLEIDVPDEDKKDFDSMLNWLNVHLYELIQLYIYLK